MVEATGTGAASPRPSACRRAASPAAGCRAAAAARARASRQRSPSTSTSPASGVEQPFEDLDRRRLAGAVRTEQAEAFAALHRRATGRRRRRRRRSVCADARSGRPVVTARICTVTSDIVQCTDLRASCIVISRFELRLDSIRVRHGPDCRRPNIFRAERRTSFADTITFSDTEALKALDAITRERPPVVALERLFAATSRGAALINRIKADPSLGGCEIRIVAHDGTPLTPRQRTDAPRRRQPRAAGRRRRHRRRSAPAAPLDQTRHARAPRFSDRRGHRGA